MGGSLCTATRTRRHQNRQRCIATSQRRKPGLRRQGSWGPIGQPGPLGRVAALRRKEKQPKDLACAPKFRTLKLLCSKPKRTKTLWPGHVPSRMFCLRCDESTRSRSVSEKRKRTRGSASYRLRAKLEILANTLRTAAHAANRRASTPPHARQVQRISQGPTQRHLAPRLAEGPWRLFVQQVPHQPVSRRRLHQLRKQKEDGYT